MGEKLGEKFDEKTGEKVGESLGENHKLNLCLQKFQECKVVNFKGVNLPNGRVIRTGKVCYKRGYPV